MGRAMSDFEIEAGEDDHPPETPYKSDTLEHIREKLQEQVPVNNAACSDCPVSIWYRDKEAVLTCFCSALHTTTWTDGCVPIEYCDGREQAVARLLATLKAQKVSR